MIHLIQVSEAMNCLEDSTMSNPVHTSEARMCGGDSLILTTAWRAVHSEKVMHEKPIRYSLPG